MLLTLVMRMYVNAWRMARSGRRGRRKPGRNTPLSRPQGIREKKPQRVRDAVLRLHEQPPDWSHRKLADAYNLRHFAATGISVGRTWVRELLKKHAYEALHRQRELKHRVPEPQPSNRT
jgi:hypothetical protein